MNYSDDNFNEISGKITDYIVHCLPCNPVEEDYVILGNFTTLEGRVYTLNLLTALPDSKYSNEYNNILEVIKPLLNQNITIKVQDNINFHIPEYNFLQASGIQVNLLTGLLISPPIPLHELSDKEQAEIKVLKEEIIAWEKEWKQIQLEMAVEDVKAWYSAFSDYAQTDDEIDIFKNL